MIGPRALAAALAALGCSAGVPAALAQFDFAGVVNAFGIETDDAPAVLRVVVGISGVVTAVAIATGLIGAVLTLSNTRIATRVLAAAAIVGLFSASVLWLPAGFAITAATLMIDRAMRDERRGHRARSTGSSVRDVFGAFADPESSCAR
jgi:hypothetical protein